MSDSVRPHSQQPTRLPPVPGILQGRTLEWPAISFSNAGKWKVKVKSLSCVQLLVTPWTAAYQAPPSMGFSRQEYWSGVPLPSPKPQHRQINKEKKKIMAIIKKSTNNKSWRGCGEKGILLHYLWECKLIQPLWRTVQTFLQNLNTEPPYDPAIPLLGMYPKKTITEKDTCMPVFITALFTIARKRKQPRCPLTDEWI